MAPERPRIYLSSSFSAFDSGAGDLLPLRAQLFECGDKLGVEVVLAERKENVAAAAANADHIGILEGCAELAAKCDAFFGVIFQRHGTRIDLSGDPALPRAEVSFFEAELLSACVSNKPVAIVVVRDSPPGEAMASFLSLVKSVLGDLLIEADEGGVAPLFDDFARAVVAGSTRPPPWLLDHVSSLRIHRQLSLEQKRPSLAFLGGIFRGSAEGKVDEAVIDLALNRADPKQGDSSAALGHITCLSYLWVAMREFAKAPQTLQADAMASRFQRALGLWNSSAAWRGMHGAHPMGCLASLSDLGFSVERSRHGSLPYGARASAYYSIGTKLRAKAEKRRFFRLAASLATSAIQQSGNSAGFSMRASALARLAGLGERLRYFDALADYKRELLLRERNQGGDSEIGEAKTEYAFALGMQPWKRKGAIRMMRDGVALMEEGRATRADFLIRGERKLAEMLLADGQLEEALVVADGAIARAVERTSFDQEQQGRDLKNRIQGRLASRR